MKYLRKATAVSAVVAAMAAAGGFYLSTPLYSADLPSSTPLLWVAANVIIIWLFSSSCRGNSNSNATSSSPVSHTVDVLDDVGVRGHGSSRRHTDVEAKRAGPRGKKARRPDRTRRRRKNSAGEEAAASPISVTAEGSRIDDHKKRGEEMPVAVPAAEARTVGSDDFSIDSLWQSIVQRRAARPVAVRKSEMWGSDELPRLHGAAETAAAQCEMRKFAPAAPPPPAPAAARPLGWRTRDALGMAQDELLRRAESFIRRQHEQLRLQRQESEQRHRPAAALIRV